MDKQLCAGFSRVSINPTEPIPLGGYGNEEQRFHQTVTEEVCVTTVALTDPADTTVLLISIDLVNADTPLCEKIRDRLSSAVSVPEDRIYISAVHSHAAPSVRRMDMPCIQRYNEMLLDRCEQSARQALTDRQRCHMYTGSVETKNLNFVKHYRAKDTKTGSLSVIGDLFGTAEGKQLLEHATNADPTLHLVRLVREGGKSIVLANFRAHPHFRGGYKKYDLSSDYIGAFRTALEALQDCHAVYFQGACGNINATTRMAGERLFTDCRSYGLALAASAAEGLATRMRPCDTGLIRTKQLRLYGQINKTSPELAAQAAQILKVWKERFDLSECQRLGKPWGIRSPYHAGAIMANMDRTPERDGLLILNAVSIGRELAFTTFPGELFDTLSVRIEENSPFGSTLLLGYCNHNMSYLPSALAYKYTCYETDITRFAPGTGEQAADACIQALQELAAREN